MDVQHKDSDDDAECDKNHGEQEVLSNQRDHQWRWRYGLSDDQQEHSEREQDGDTQGDLLATVGWEVKHQDCEEGDEEARDDEVDCVEERKAANVEGVGDVSVDLLTAVILDVVLVPRCVDDLPLTTLPEVFHVNLSRKRRQKWFVIKRNIRKIGPTRWTF